MDFTGDGAHARPEVVQPGILYTEPVREVSRVGESRAQAHEPHLPRTELSVAVTWDGTSCTAVSWDTVTWNTISYKIMYKNAKHADSIPGVID